VNSDVNPVTNSIKSAEKLNSLNPERYQNVTAEGFQE
jgi:hypothetical protein